MREDVNEGTSKNISSPKSPELFWSSLLKSSQSCSIMLTILFITSVISHGHAVVNYGRDFVTAFPENIAYYYPSYPINVLKITALNDNTNFSVTFNGTNVDKGTLNGGQTKAVYLSSGVEEYQLNRSSKSIRITSNNDITVFSISRRGDSVQTNVVQPVGNLGKEYLIPFPNFTEIILMLNNYNVSNQTDSSGSSSPSQTYNFLRLLIINAEDKDNTVTIKLKQSKDTTFKLSPFELIQMQGNDSLVKVTASANISVLLTHPCLDTYYCRCSIVIHQLRPANLLGDSFLVPPFYITNHSRMFLTSDQSVQLKYGSPPLYGSQTLDPGKSDFLPFYHLLTDGFSNITTSQLVSLRLINIGSLIDLIPVSMFSACYLVHTTSATKSQAVIIVETTQASYTRLDSGVSIPTAEWTVINGTKYSWAAVDLNLYRSYIIWHPFSKMAIYVFEKMATWIAYGGPAISIKEEPNPQGCLMSSAVLDVSNLSISWQASRQYCVDKGTQLASPSWANAHYYITQKLTEVGASGQAWIGLRRHLLTREWYWQNGQGLDFSNWERGQPVIPEKGMCASMRMEPNGNYTWSSVQCCSSLKLMCYTPPRYFSLIDPYA
ncbi:hypothetical protein SRHO_G00281480 [Serrasalmus rhombeus]